MKSKPLTYGPAFRPLSAALRALGTCADCKRRFPPRDLDTHHVTPVRLGGTDHPSNLVTLCASCHAKRDARIRALQESLRPSGNALYDALIRRRRSTSR